MGFTSLVFWSKSGVTDTSLPILEGLQNVRALSFLQNPLPRFHTATQSFCLMFSLRKLSTETDLIPLMANSSHLSRVWESKAGVYAYFIHNIPLRILWCRPGKECYSHFTGEGTKPQRNYLRSKSRKLQSELNSVFILPVTWRSKQPSKPVPSLLSFLPSSLCADPASPHSCSTVVSCVAYHDVFLLHLTDFSSQLPKTPPASLPSNCIGHFFYFVAFLGECFNASYFKIKPCTTLDSFTGGSHATCQPYLSGSPELPLAILFQLEIFASLTLFLHF